MYNLTILIVDDIKYNTCPLKEKIKKNLDVKTYTASSLDETKQIISTNNIDLILVGMNISYIKCKEFIENSNFLKEFKSIPIFCIRDICEINNVNTSDFTRVEYIPYNENDELLIRKLKVYICIYNAIKESNRTLNISVNTLVIESKLSSIAEIIKLIYNQLNQPYNILSSNNKDINISYYFNESIKKFKNDFSLYNKKQMDILNNSVKGFLDIFTVQKNYEKINISSCINNCINLLRKKIDKLDIKFEFKIDNSLEVIGVGLELSQVILNILNNSIDAFNQNKTLNPKITIKLYQKDSKSILSIKDNAGGVDIGILESISKPYITTKDDSKGIGLYFVKLIIQKSFGGKYIYQNQKSGLKSKIILNYY